MLNLDTPPSPTLSVSLLNRSVREHLEGAFPLTWVAGEISNLTYATSGHVYFSLKDATAQVRCTMWRNKAQLLGWRLENGQKIEVRALVTLFEARGDFQLSIENIRRAGQGDLFQQFLLLKAKLEAEGLFDPSRKRPLPSFPRRIALVTSPQAAALRDVLATFRRRAPHITLTIYPTPVQGEGAATRIAAALAEAGRSAHDLILLCRGGGSIEDLWAFNEECVARALAASPLPVISGVGHETDFTIADFAADLRAPTPTAAAELASPDAAALLQRLNGLETQLKRSQQRRLSDAGQNIDWLTARLIHPAERLRLRAQELDRLAQRLRHTQTHHLASLSQQLKFRQQGLLAQRPQTQRSTEKLASLNLRLEHGASRYFDSARSRLGALATSLRQLDPHAVLSRGYTLVRDKNGKIIRDSAQLSADDALQLTFGRGQARATVEAVIAPQQEQSPLL